MGALTNTLVVSIEQAVAAPYCTRLLAEAGARIIKIERPGGDFARHYDAIVNGESAYFVWLNSGKESLLLDAKDESDKQLLGSILAKADVFIQNLRPGAVESLGFGYDSLKKINPRIIMCSISGYGSEGSYAEKKAYDFLVQGESGLCSITGAPGEPARVGISVCDISTGLTAYSEILRALLERNHSGVGEHLDISLFDVMAEWMSVPLAVYKNGGKLLSGTGLDHSQIAPYGVHQAADGPFIIAVQHEGEWRNLCSVVLGRKELADDPRFSSNVLRLENRIALTEAIENFTRQYTRAEIAEKMEAGGIAYGNLNNCRDVWDHPALKTKEVVSGGKTSVFVRRVCDKSSTARAIPGLGEHSGKIRAEFLDA
jgi:crotonobetainyl-CoA:carnitine CoA-transferase CaiB-like acyl-CoA transferase